jgi:acyl carrier protein
LLAALLRIAQVRTTDNFFEIGGDSLSAVRLTQAARATFDVVLPIRTVFNRPVVSDLADAIEELRCATIPEAHQVCTQDAPIPVRLLAEPGLFEEILEL